MIPSLSHTRPVSHLRDHLCDLVWPGTVAQLHQRDAAMSLADAKHLAMNMLTPEALRPILASVDAREALDAVMAHVDRQVPSARYWWPWSLTW